MPTYNAGVRIGAAISGVLTQTYPDVELVVVDDGSTDDTVRIAEGFGDRLTVIRQANAGPNAARNAGIRAATGEVIAWCDSDDFLLPNYLATAMAVLEESPARTWVTCASRALTERGLSDYGYSPFGRVARADQREAILQVNFVSIFSVFPRAMVEEVGPLREDLHRCEDWEYWARAIFSGWRVAFQPETASLYRQQGASQSSDPTAMMDAEDAMIAGLAERFGAVFTPREREILRARAERGSAQRQRQHARQSWSGGEFRAGARQLRGVARDFPFYRGLRRKSLMASVMAPVLELLPDGSVVRERMRNRW
jgi:glycosyltransferase involved in cell wall biosynthesis